MNSDIFKTLAEPVKGFFKDRGSRFNALAFPVDAEEEVKNIIAKIKKEYHDATHHCYAYRIGSEKEIWRVNDDGEPSGSAGRPIYGQIQSKELTDILIVVIRYFGGVKLGVTGLINAYRNAAADALANGEIISKTVNVLFVINFEYAVMNHVMKIIKDENILQLEHQLDLHCKIKLSIRKRDADRILVMFRKIEGIKVEIC